MPLYHRSYFLLLIALSLVLGSYAIMLVLKHPSTLDANGHYYGLDFMNYWAGPQIAAKDITQLFDISRYNELRQELYGSGSVRYNWSYPLHALPLLTPLGMAPYMPAFLGWTLVGLTLYLLVMWRGGLNHKRFGLLLALLAPATVLNVLYGQNGFFTASFFLGALLYEQHKPQRAGILLGLLTTKPQLGIVWPLYLLLKARWHVIAVACISAAILLCISLSFYGIEAWRAYFATVTKQQMHLLMMPVETVRLYQVTMPTLPMALQKMGVVQSMAFQCQWIMSAVVVVLLICLLRRSYSFSRTALLLASAAMLVTPYLFTYDMTIMTGTIVWHMLAQHRLTLAQKIIYGAGYLLPALVYWLYFFLPIAPFIMLLVFLLVTLECFYETQLPYEEHV